jgi:hypothetical protein
LCPVSHLKNIHNDQDNWKPAIPESEGLLISRIEFYDVVPFAEVQEFHYI